MIVQVEYKLEVMLTNHKISNRITDAAPLFISVSVWSFEADPFMMPESIHQMGYVIFPR